MINYKTNILLVVAIILFAPFCSKGVSNNSNGNNNNGGGDTSTATTETVVPWVTDPDHSVLFQQAGSLLHYNAPTSTSVIDIDDKQTFQTMDGFGYTLTGGSAMLLQGMDAASRASLLNELFAWDKNNIGVSYLRVSIGSSDLDDHVFSYDDLAAGLTDSTLSKFSISTDEKYLIPVLKQILAINPAIKILGSPWSPPAWMKSNNSTMAGSLLAAYYSSYANYFVKYIQAMKAEGITIDAITIQNEPLNPNNNPSMVMQPTEEGSFIKTALGPAFAAAGIQTKIFLYDHNCDRPDYPTTILDDTAAAKYVDGSAFHLYAGSINALTSVHNAHPDKNLYFTEQWVGAPGNLKGDMDWHIANVVIGSALNWSRVALEWNLASDPTYSIHTPGGCTQCLGAVTISGSNFNYNPAWYTIAHAAKFIRPGSVRIASPVISGLVNAAFKTPSGSIILLVENTGTATADFNIRFATKAFAASLNPGAVATYVCNK